MSCAADYDDDGLDDDIVDDADVDANVEDDDDDGVEEEEEEEEAEESVASNTCKDMAVDGAAVQQRSSKLIAWPCRDCGSGDGVSSVFDLQAPPRPISVDVSKFCAAASMLLNTSDPTSTITTPEATAEAGAEAGAAAAAVTPLDAAIHQAAKKSTTAMRFQALTVDSFFGFALVFALQPNAAYARRLLASAEAPMLLERGGGAIDASALVVDNGDNSGDDQSVRFNAIACQRYFAALLRRNDGSVTTLCAENHDFRSLLDALESAAAAAAAVGRLESLHVDTTTGRFHLWISDADWLSDPTSKAQQQQQQASSQAIEVFARVRERDGLAAARRGRFDYYLRKALKLAPADCAVLADALIDSSLDFDRKQSPFFPAIFSSGSQAGEFSSDDIVVAPRSKLARFIAAGESESSATAEQATKKASNKRKRSGKDGEQGAKDDSSVATLASCLEAKKTKSSGASGSVGCCWAAQAQWFCLRMWHDLVERMFGVDPSKSMLAQYGVASLADWIVNPPMRNGLDRGGDGGGDDEDDDARAAADFDMQHLQRLATPDAHLRHLLVGWLVARQRSIEYINGFLAHVTADARGAGYLLKQKTPEVSKALLRFVKQEREAAAALPCVVLWSLDWPLLARDVARPGGAAKVQKNAAFYIERAQRHGGVFAYWRAAGQSACRTYNATYFHPRVSPGLERVQPWRAAALGAEQRLADGERRRGNLNRWCGHTYEYDGDVAHLYAPRQARGRWLRPAAGYNWHLYRHICGARLDEFAYVVRWFAHALQAPFERCSQALLLMGPPGGGKGVCVEAQRHIVGARHAVHVLRSEYDLLGQFNPLLKDRTLVFADEFSEPKSAAQRGMLKGLITEEKQVIRELYVGADEQQSYVRLVMASNEPRPVKVDPQSRRYAVFHTERVDIEHCVTKQLLQLDNDDDDDEKARVAAFHSLVGESERKDYGALGARIQALLQYRVDLRQYNARAPAPKTPALCRLTEESMDSLDEWWHNVLCRGVHVCTMLPPAECEYRALQRESAVKRREAERVAALGAPEPEYTGDEASMRLLAEHRSVARLADADVPRVKEWQEEWQPEAQTKALYMLYARYVSKKNSSSNSSSGSGNKKSNNSDSLYVDKPDARDCDGKEFGKFRREFVARYLPNKTGIALRWVKAWNSHTCTKGRGFKMPPLKECREIFQKRFGSVAFNDDFDEGEEDNAEKEQVVTPVAHGRDCATTMTPYSGPRSKPAEPVIVAEAPAASTPSSSYISATPEQKADKAADFSSIDAFLGVTCETLLPSDAAEDPLFAARPEEKWRRVLRDLGLKEFREFYDSADEALGVARRVSLSEAVCEPLHGRRLTWLPTTSRAEQCALLASSMCTTTAEEIVDAFEAAARAFQQPVVLVFYPGPETLYFGDLRQSARVPTLHVALFDASESDAGTKPIFAVLERVTVDL